MLKNVVYIYDFGRNVGGINPIVANSANHLSKKYKVYVCTGDTVFQGLDDKVETVSFSDVCSEGKGEAQRALRSIWNFTAQKNAREFLLKFNNEDTIVHFHGWGMGLSVSVLKVAKSLGFKCIYTAHDYSIGCPNGVYYRFDTQENCSLEPLSFKCMTTACDKKGSLVKSQRIIRKYIERSSIDMRTAFEKIICVSEIVRATLIGFGLDANKMLVKRNPYQIIANEPQLEEIHRDHYVYIGRLELEKGILDFCHAVTDVKVKAKIIGSGALLEYVRKKYPEIECTGWVEPKQIMQHLRNVKCLILPSRWREPSALVVEDALVNGIFVIVPSETGAEEKVTDAEGIVFDKGSISSLINAIENMEKRELNLMSTHVGIQNILSYQYYSRYLKDIYEGVLSEI